MSLVHDPLYMSIEENKRNRIGTGKKKYRPSGEIITFGAYVIEKMIEKMIVFINLFKLEQFNQLHKYIEKKLYIYNSGQNIWNRLEKSSKTGQDKRTLISTFTCFLTCFLTAITYISTFTCFLTAFSMSPSKFEIFLIFPYLQRS